jgi:peptidoglycan/LPS O-acetylase OafA/YrhL
MSRQFPALRGIAIFLVVLNHAITLSLLYRAEGGYEPLHDIENFILVAFRTLGIIAVPAFYFFSGGYLVYAVRGKPLTAAYNIVARSLRPIIVPYLLWSVMFYIFIYLLQGDQYTTLEYLKFILVGYPFHFIPLLIFYYLVSPILIRLIDHYPWPTMIVIALYQIFSVMVLLPSILGVGLPAWTRYLTIPGIRNSIAIWGIFLPLGILYSLQGERMRLALRRVMWLLVTLAAISYVFAVLQELDLYRVPVANLLNPLFVILLFPLITRESIPFAWHLEQLGRRTYGLYLTNLILLSIGLVIAEKWASSLFSIMLIFVPILVVFTISALWTLMTGTEKLPSQNVRRYLFG